MRDFAFVKQEDGAVVRHVFIRTQEANQLTENYTMNEIDPEMTKFREKQHNSSIDTLTNQLKQMDTDVKAMENALDKKIGERDVTKDVLRLKLEDTLSTLNVEEIIAKTDEKPIRMSPTMLSAKDLSNKGIDSHTDEPVRKMSHESA